MLIVNEHALEAIDLLDLIDEIARQFLDTLDGKDVVGGGVPVEDVLTLLDGVAFLQMERLSLRDEVFDRFCRLILGLDDDAPLVLVVASKFDRAVDLGNDRMVLRTAGFEQLGYTRQTAGDVLGLGALERDTREDVARRHLLAGLDIEDRIHRQEVPGVAPAFHLRHCALAGHSDRRLQAFATRIGPPVGDHALGEARGFVGLLGHRRPVDQILVGHFAIDFGQHRTGVGIPFGDTLAALDLVAIIDAQLGPVRHAVRGAVLALVVHDRDRDVATHGDKSAARDLGHVAVADDDLAFRAGLEERAVDHLRRTTDVERTHGELGARFADRLRRDNADGFADIDRRTASEVAAVAGCTAARTEVAGERRADLDALHSRGLDHVHVLFGKQNVGLDDDLAGLGIVHWLSRRPAENALTQSGNDLAGIDDGLHREAAVGPAIELGDDRVLRDVDETTGQVTRVRRLQRGVREALAGTVGRVEVLENVEAFLEVGRDRSLDDRAVGTRHEAAHAGELLHLRR